MGTSYQTWCFSCWLEYHWRWFTSSGELALFTALESSLVSGVHLAVVHSSFSLSFMFSIRLREIDKFTFSGYINWVDISERWQLNCGMWQDAFLKLATVIDSCIVIGSLATSVTDPWTILCGASGGCYALIGAHFAKIIMVCLFAVICCKSIIRFSQWLWFHMITVWNI